MLGGWQPAHNLYFWAEAIRSMKLKPTRLFLVFLATLFLVNLLQSHFTELLFDEAYYWHYASRLSWGYFDHPPMVALLIKVSGWLFRGELGVRFMSCVLSAGTLVILWNIVEDKRKQDYIPHFFVLVLSMTLLHAYGFFTLPDTPLLFFTAMFLWLYQHFLHKATIPLSIGLGLVMAGLMYSKYHAVLVILCVLASNIRLVLNPHAWLAVAVALFSYFPHLAWLYEHDFVSIRYHLFERPNRAYDFNDFTLGFFINLLAIFGLTFPWIYQSLFKTRSKDRFTRALLFLVYGVLVFFFVSSFQRRVQTQWIIVVSIPMAVIAFRYMLEHPAARTWILRAGVANLVILAYLRVGLIYEPLFPIVFETHGNKEWVQQVQAVAGERPVVFENSYREAPMYAFYSGHPSYSLNNVFYRENQYNIDGTEAQLQGKEVLYIAKRFKEGDMSYTIANGNRYYGKFIEDFESYRELECRVEMPVRTPDEVALLIKVYNPYQQNIPLTKLKFGTAYLNRYKEVKDFSPATVVPADTTTTVLMAKDSTEFYLQLPQPEIQSPSYFRLAISDNGLFWGINSENIKLEAWNP